MLIEKMTEALKTLRTEILPLSVNTDRVCELYFYLLSSTMPHTDGAVNGSYRLRVVKPKLEELQKFSRVIAAGNYVKTVFGSSAPVFAASEYVKTMLG
ncbi:hypothetical protein Tco_0232347 [Tanacetum coccineum]